MSTAKHPLEEGMHFFQKKKGARKAFIYVKEGVLWLPAAILHPIIAMTCGKPLIMCNDVVFMRASDIIEELPSTKEKIEALAEGHGLSL